MNAQAVSSSDLVGETIPLGDGRTLRLGDLRGRGQAASVYSALVSSAFKVRRPIAVKVFDPVPSEEAAGRIDALARAVRKGACVVHANVASPLEFTVHHGLPVVVSELVDGVSLEVFAAQVMLQKRRVPTDLALFLALEIAEGLVGAREARTPDGKPLGMRHHDLSPREVLLSWRGEVKLTDFGVTSALRAAGSGITSLAALARRCATMAPEVVSGERGDARSDIFGLGIILRQLLVGPRFPSSMSDAEKLAAARDGDIPIGLFERPLPEPMASILERALALEPSHRYPEPAALAFDLRRACLSLGVGDGRVFLRGALHELFPRREPSDPTRPEPRRAKTESGEIAVEMEAADEETTRQVG